jgi:hypothetical protein
MDLDSHMIIYRHLRHGTTGLVTQFVGFPTHTDDVPISFLNPGPIIQMVRSPALADDVVGRIDVTTSASVSLSNLI